MSKLFKRTVAFLSVVALLVSGYMPVVVADQTFGRPDGTGSITVTRVAGDNFPVQAPGHLVPGVPIRIRQVTFQDGVIPTPEQLNNPLWMVTPNVTFVGTAIYGLTDEDGEIVFNNNEDGLAQGIWLVEELPTLTVNANTVNRGDRAVGTVVTNPIDSVYHFDNFIVGIPRWVEDADHEDGGAWNFHVSVYPKSGIPEYRTPYKRPIYYSDDIATWEVGQRIPSLIASVPYFSVTDILPTTLTFIEGTVEGRFTIGGNSGNGWHQATGRLIEGDHFTVSNIGRLVTIEITEEGRQYLAEHGLLGEGHIMFRLETEINGVGIIPNESEWRVGIPAREPGNYNICGAEMAGCFAVDEPPTITTFNMEITKLNTARQSLQGAEFGLYRTLTATELAALPATPAGAESITIADTTFYVVPLLRLEGENRVPITGVTGSNGVTNFDGANMSSYPGLALFLRELDAPTGYRIIDEWLPVIVTTATAYEDTYVVHVTVFNEPENGWNLPDTGGVGTIILTVVGLGLVGGALAIFVGNKKEETA